MIETPKGLRLHIGLFGRRNSGKSTLMNALTGQAVSIVSARPGTTTDPVEKAAELAALGPVLFIDTAGIDDGGDGDDGNDSGEAGGSGETGDSGDSGGLGRLRVQRTRAVLARVDLGIVVVGEQRLGDDEIALIAALRERATPLLVVFNKSDLLPPVAGDLARLQALGVAEADCVAACALDGSGIDRVRQAIVRIAPEPSLDEAQLLGDLVAPGDLVVLVVPIDLGAPKGRLILPQVQTLRDLLDSDAMALMVKERELAPALARLGQAPKLVVCDSQVVLKVVADTPRAVALTTFSILMARFKGDMVGLAAGAAAIASLRPGDRVLIAEACTHHALADDIGRVKIPRWLRQFAGGDIAVEVRSGADFPDDLSPYALIVQCGGCTVTRRQILLRQYRAAAQRVPMTNYGMAISVVQGVLERTLECFPAALNAYRAAARRASA